VSLLGKSPEEVDAKVAAAFDYYFLNNDPAGPNEGGHRLYFPKGADEAVIWAGPASGKEFYVLTEGQSYGMMIAVQLNRRDVFDRLWRFVKKNIQYRSGDRKGYTCWKALSSGVCGPEAGDENPATDGEEYFATALLFASSRWGNTGAFNYEAEAQYLLDLMRLGPGKNASDITPMFDAETFLPVFTPIGKSAGFTLPAYNIPAFFEIWGRRAERGKEFWMKAAARSRVFHTVSFHPKTGLSPYMAAFNGAPYPDGPDFNDDSCRAIMNVAVDQAWFGKNPEAAILADRLLTFFHKEGMKTFKQVYTLEGRPKVSWQSTSTVAMAATGAMVSTLPIRKDFVQRLWDEPLPEGKYRYFNGLLYTLAILHLSGHFQNY
jgi:endo-1,4-beta-D-glucanase Y